MCGLLNGEIDGAGERFRNFLRHKGLRLTPERMQLLKVALNSPSHFDADTLVAKMRRRERKVSRATIYRTLALLEECGILRRSLLGQNRGLYETALDREHHDHLVCAGCGRIVEFHNEEIERLQEKVASESGFTLIEHVYEIFGLCAECRGRSTAGEENP